MARWLFKEEPTHYSFADLERDGETLWDGISNNLALQHLRKVRPGEQVLYYHSGKEKAIVGVMEVLSVPEPSPGARNERIVAVRVRAVRRLQCSVPLGRIKADPQLADWDLVRLPRLSVLPVTEVQWARVDALSRSPA